MAVESAVVTPREWVRQFKAEIAAHPKLRVGHPFVQAIGEGRVSREHLREWVRQDYKFRNIVPRISMLRYLACSDPAFTPRLYEVVEEETAGLATGSAGHIDLFVQFAAALGIDRAELDAAPLAPATAAHLYFVELIIHTRPWFVVQAAQLAAEGTAPAAMAALASGLKRHYGLSDEAVAFFTVHVDADEDHGNLAEEIAEHYLLSPALQAETREVGLRRLELLYDTWTIDGFQTGQSA